MTPVAPEIDVATMSLPSIKLTLSPDLRAYVDRRVALGGCVDAGEYMRQLIRSDAAARHDRRFLGALAARTSGLDALAVGDSGQDTVC